ncbi:putative sterigmatocystin biosynthesis P450 monooxygenase stcS-like protein 6 [Colletotrichum chlorophyti]|uniref:Putative sterigmatocystin biosynthesis P450 monooxygenase stcS-like protein 6 n=1 Tax=Colletotrichum chlorophyti TaxID=708187 RepID=A0A1Q8RXU7_9PEZI|nr:putative sterigmatocystin biosynthesis P450 monooxygenase stcS-like protein 6 [Colletotrichum chlorophyti]
MIYVDVWPMGPPIILVVDPETAGQLINDPTLKRSQAAEELLTPPTDNLDLVRMEGEEWKTWRARFNPSLSNKNVLTLMPGMLEDVKIFCNIVRKRAGTAASGAMFLLWRS